MKKILIIILAILCATSAFADFKFTGKAKIVWAYDFNNGEFTASGREGEAAANMTVRATGDFYSIVLQGALYSRSSATEGIRARITLRAIKLLEEFDIKFDKIKAFDLYAGNSIIRGNHVYADPFGHDDGSVQLLIATNYMYFPYGFELAIGDFTFKTGMTLASDSTTHEKHQEFGFNLKGSFLNGALLAEAGFAYNNDTNEPTSKDRRGHKFEDGGNGRRFGTSFSVDVAKLAGSENLNAILSADAQLNLDNKDANAYYAAAVVKYKNWIGGFEYKYIPKTIEEWKEGNLPKISRARITAVEGIIQYTFDTKHTPKIFVTAGYMLDRHDLDSEFKDSGLLFGIGASIKVKEMTVKVEYKNNDHEMSKHYGQNKLNFEINFSF